MTAADGTGWVCPVCGGAVAQLVRVGDYLFSDPCAHRVLDLRRLDWYARRYTTQAGTPRRYVTRRAVSTPLPPQKESDR